MMIRATVAFLLLVCMLHKGQAQDSSRLRFSLLTCTPGQELYATFGHSALRMIDSNAVADVVFNYGTFDFNDPNFYSKFVRGKLLYALSIERFDDFMAQYEWENRGVTEQLLNFSAAEKKMIKIFLTENAKEQNRWYRYDFTFDNCTTRLRDIIIQNKQPRPQLPPVMDTNASFRDAIHLYLDKNNHDWSKLGIDLLLGSRLDKKMTVDQQQFLPDNLMNALNGATNSKIVSMEQVIFQNNQIEEKGRGLSPLFLFSAICIIWILASIFGNSKLQWIVSSANVVLYFICGAIGVLLLFMWFATDHYMTKNNYNLIWAVPTHLIAAFFQKKQSFKLYFLFTGIIALALVIFWNLLPQQLNTSLIPIVILLGVQSLLTWKKLSNANKVH